MVRITSIHPSSALSRVRGAGSGSGLAQDGLQRWWRGMLLLSLSCAMCVRFTSKGGAKGNSDGQPVCNTLHGVVWQLGQRIQLLPRVGRGGNAFLRAAEQHDVAAHIQRALDTTCWHRGGHWQMGRGGGDMLTTLQSEWKIFLIAEESLSACMLLYRRLYMYALKYKVLLEPGRNTL